MRQRQFNTKMDADGAQIHEQFMRQALKEVL